MIYYDIIQTFTFSIIFLIILALIPSDKKWNLQDDELPPLESVELEPPLGGGTFRMGIYGYGMEMLWKTHHLLDISVWDIVWYVFFGSFWDMEKKSFNGYTLWWTNIAMENGHL